MRLPFIALFALTTFLMYRVTAALFDPEAGLVGGCRAEYGAGSRNHRRQLGLARRPALRGPARRLLFCLVAALRSEGRAAWGWWLATGICAGLALCSKYSAVLTLIGAVAFLVTEPTSRRWLMRPHPYVAGIVALVIFLPVLVWNAGHGWVSFLFQGGRAGGRSPPVRPLIVAVAGQAAFLLPWIWAPLMWCGVVALRRGPSDRERWLLVCLAAPPILVFTMAALVG